MSCSTDANTGGAIRDASKPSIDAAGAEFVIAGAEPVTGSAEAVTGSLHELSPQRQMLIKMLGVYVQWAVAAGVGYGGFKLRATYILRLELFRVLFKLYPSNTCGIQLYMKYSTVTEGCDRGSTFCKGTAWRNAGFDCEQLEERSGLAHTTTHSCNPPLSTLLSLLLFLLLHVFNPF